MLIRADDENASEWKVIFNGRWALHALAADDTEGWIEVLDQAWLAKLLDTRATSTPTEDTQLAELESIPTKRIYGQVRLERVVNEEKPEEK